MLKGIHLKKNKEEAIRYFKLAGDFQAAGMIYQDLKDYTNAVDCFLKSETGEKDGYCLAKQAARKVRDIQSVYKQAKSLFDAGLYKIKKPSLFFYFQQHQP